MAQATGIGGVFFRSRDPEGLRDWYAEHLGLEVNPDGVVLIRWGGDHAGSTVLAPFADDTDYFGARSQASMVNYRVDDLDEMLAQLRTAGVEVDDQVQEMDGIGRFGWAVDPEGNRFELWEPAPGA